MQCPNCKTEISGPPCPDCGKANPEEARYCMACGAMLEKALEALEDGEEAPDMENRVLCPDGTCTGIIVDGRCTECGRSVADTGAQAA